MKTKVYLYGSLLSVPLIVVLYYFLLPPECPIEYTQAQVDASRCIIGANIGGPPLFIISAPLIWLLCIKTVKNLSNRHKHDSK